MEVHYQPSYFFQASRCTLENWESESYDYTNDTNPNTQKKGIRCYSFLTSLILRLFSLVKIVQTENGTNVYLNKKSFKKWEEWRFPSTSEDKSPQTEIAETVQTIRENRIPKQTKEQPQKSITQEVQIVSTDKEALPDVGETVLPVVEKELLPDADETVLPDVEKEILPDADETVLPEKNEVVAVPAKDPAENTSSASSVSHATLKLIEAVVNDCGEDLANIWKTLLQRIPSDHIVSFEIKGKHEYSLKLRHPISLWLNSRSKCGKKAYPKGGTIVLLGHNNNSKLEFTTNSKLKKISFKAGMKFWCKTPIGIRDVEVVHMSDKGKTEIELKAGCRVPVIGLKTKSERHSKKDFQKVWSEATLLGENADYKKYLSLKASKETQRV